MKITPNDPRLTAYALGELDAADRAAIELELQHSPECRHAVEQIQITTAQLTEEFRTEELPALTHAQQRAIRTEFTPPQPSTFSWARLLFYGGAVAVAVLFIALLLPAMSKARSKSIRPTHLVVANNPASGPDGLNSEVIVTASLATVSDASGKTSFSTTTPQTTSAGQKPLESPPAIAPNDPSSPLTSLAVTRFDENVLTRYGDSLTRNLAVRIPSPPVSKSPAALGTPGIASCASG